MISLFRHVLILCLFAVTLVVVKYVDAQSFGTVNFDGRVQGCGDGVIDSGEECDMGNLAGASCQSRGFTSGTLACTSTCLFNTLSCVYTPPSSNSGGGGGGSNVTGAQVVLSGRAYPRSEITILKDAQVVATTIADDQAHFQVLIKGLSSGKYFFSLYGEDIKGIRSSLLTFPINVTKNILTKIENIFVAPTITGDKIEVKKGSPIVLFGQSYPFSEVTIEVNSTQQYLVKSSVGQDGVYLKSINTEVLEIGANYAKARSTAKQIISSQSAVYAFTVGSKDVAAIETKLCSDWADVNVDCRVNLVDFSIVAFWYLRPLSPEFILREAKHLNGDAKINLIDFSIMAFHWTG